MTQAVARQRLLLLSELTLAALTVVAVVSLARLFADGSFLPTVVFVALLAHGLAAVCRRRLVDATLAVLLAIFGLVLVLTWTQLGDTTRWLLPTGDTLDVFRTEVSGAWRTFGEVVAPAPVLPGFVLLASIGAWVIAFTADAAAFRTQARVEAVIPAATLFVFSGALGTGRYRVVLGGLFVAVVAAHWLCQRTLTRVSSPSWLATGSGGSMPSLLRAGAALAAIGVVAAVAIGPNLPGAGARAVVPWRATDRESPRSRVTISPLVDIRARLVDQANVEVFRVRADRRAYWRLTSLEQFDGRIWKSNRQYGSASGSLDPGVETGRTTAARVRATFRIGALSSIWLPAPFRPVRVEGAEARYDTDSNSLLAKADTPAGLTYTVESQLPDLTAAQLQRVGPVAPRRIAEEYTALPAGFSIDVQRLAERVVGTAGTQYERARALQDFFRGGSFTYDLTIVPSHDGRDLENFLFRTRRGYCEQFAGAYAAMARAIGLPTRVAVGFTPGELDTRTGEYVVRGLNAHSWPEVYLDGFGWVAFEPTPGRGAPNAEAYTGVPEQQAQATNPAVATTVPATVPTTAPGGSTATTRPARPDQGAPRPPVAAAGSPWPRRLAVTAAVLLLGPLLWAAALALWRARRRHRRRASAVTPDERVLLAWDEVTEALARAGRAAHPWETPAEFAARVGGTTPVDSSLLTGLAKLTTAATYSSDALPDLAADEAASSAARLQAEADSLLGRRDRLWSALDPRPLLPDRRPRVDVRGS